MLGIKVASLVFPYSGIGFQFLSHSAEPDTSSGLSSSALRLDFVDSHLGDSESLYGRLSLFYRSWYFWTKDSWNWTKLVEIVQFSQEGS